MWDNNVARDKKDIKHRRCLGPGCLTLINTCRNWRICDRCRKNARYGNNAVTEGAWGHAVKQNKK